MKKNKRTLRTIVFSEKLPISMELCKYWLILLVLMGMFLLDITNGMITVQKNDYFLLKWQVIVMNREL